MAEFKVLLFYKYVKIEDTLALVGWHKAYGAEYGLKGRILIGDEGINATLAGKTEDADSYVAELKKDPRFADIDFKESNADSMPFPKLKVKYRKEIVTLGLENDVDMTSLSTEQRGTYLTPDEVQQLVDKGDEYYFVDARNEYEAKIGKFKDAIIPEIENFREFPEFLKKMDHLKNKKVIFYCTGGIRCEKATAYAKREGFEDVYHIQGGIQRYAEKYPKGAFEGSMYIFDDRIAVQFDKDPDRKIITECMYCAKPCDEYKNCFNSACNARIIVCDDCYKTNEGCCSLECREIKHPRKVKFRFEDKLV